MARQFAIGVIWGNTYVADADTRTYTTTAGATAATVSAVNVSVNAATNSATITCGNVTVTANQSVSVSATGNSLAISVNDVAAGGSTSVSVTIDMTATSLSASVGDFSTVRLAPGNPLGSGMLIGNTATIPNPFPTTANGAMVITGDLIYAVITQETNNTVTAMTDNLGNTYTACNAGSDVGAITGRAYYTIVTVPGLLTSVSATVTASSNNAILLAQAFQGPFSGIDANPANVGSDITSPYVGPSTGTLSQAAELLVAWATRPDSVSLVAVSPLVSIGQTASASVIRTQLSYQVLAATTSVAPSWTSSSDPGQLLSGATSFAFDTGAASVSVDATTNSAAISVGNVSVLGKAIVNADTNLLTASTNDVTVTGKARVDAATNLATMTAGNVLIPQGISVNALGNEIAVGLSNVVVSEGGASIGIQLTSTAGTVSVTGIANAIATGNALTATAGRGTVRLLFGNPLGPMLVASLASITNPFVAVNVSVEVQYGDLIYAVLTEQTNLTVTAMTDNLGHSYTALNAGSDSGAVTSRAFYTLVTTPGMLTQVSASTTSTSDNAVMLVQAFQGSFTPLTPLDASPSNSVNLDIVSPYVGPSTGTLGQADELMVAWLSRPDSTNMNSVAPLITIGQINSATVLRTLLSYQVLAATTSIAPSFTSATDPTQTIMGVSTFKKSVGGGTNVSVNALGIELTSIVGNATVAAISNISVNAATNLITASTNANTVATGGANVDAASNLLTTLTSNVTVTGKANVTTASDQLTISTNDVQVGEVTGTSVNATSNLLTMTAGDVGVTQGVGVSVNAASQFCLISTNDVLVRAGAGASAATNLLTMTAGTIPSVTGKANVTVTNVPQMTITTNDVTVVGKAIVTTTGTSLGMTMSTSTPTVGLSGIATITAMPAMAISTAQVGGVTITGHASIMALGNEMTISCGNVFVSTPGTAGTSTARGEGQMLVMSRLMGN
jgi:hypothetical protein